MDFLDLGREIEAAISATFGHNGGKTWWPDLAAAYHRADATGRMSTLKSKLTDPYFSEFLGTMRVVADGGFGLNVDLLTLWVVCRAEAVGVTQVLTELQRYHDSKTFSCTFVIALAGLRVDQVVQLGDGVRLIPFTGSDFLRERVRHERQAGDPLERISCALQVAVQHPKLYHPIHEGLPAEGREIAKRNWAILEAARLCLALVRPSVVTFVGRTIFVDESVPVSNLSSAYYTATVEGPSTIAWSGVECSLATEVHSAYCRLSIKAKDNLRVPLERFNSALLESWKPVDSAIDLGIALEALLLSDMQQTEISYRFALRGAHLIGGQDRVARRHLFDVFGGLYDLRSAAVHKGALADKVKRPKGMTSRELLQTGYGLAAQAIREVIERSGTIDWENMVLG